MANFITSNPGIAAFDNRTQRLATTRAEDLRLQREKEQHDQNEADRQAYAAYLSQGLNGGGPKATAQTPLDMPLVNTEIPVGGQSYPPTASMPIEITPLPETPSNAPRQITHGDVINTGRATYERPTSYNNSNLENLAIKGLDVIDGEKRRRDIVDAVVKYLGVPINAVQSAHDYLTSRPTRPTPPSTQTVTQSYEGPSTTSVSPMAVPANSEEPRRNGVANVSASLLNSLINQETGGDANAISPAGAAGIAQIMPETAKNPGYGVRPLQGWDGKDPRTAPVQEQLRFAKDYLEAMIANRGGSVAEGLASYNAGPGAVASHGGVPPYPETRNYVEKVMAGAGLPQSTPPQLPTQSASGLRSQATQTAAPPPAPQPIPAVQPQSRQPLGNYLSSGRGSLAAMQSAAAQQDEAQIKALTFASAGHPAEAEAYARLHGITIPSEVLENSQLSHALALGGTAYKDNPQAGQTFIQTWMTTPGSTQDKTIAAMNAAGRIPTSDQRKLLELNKIVESANGQNFAVNNMGMAVPVMDTTGNPLMSAVKPNEDPYFKAAADLVKENIQQSGEAMAPEDILKQINMLATQMRANAGLGGQTGLQAQASGQMNNLPVVTDQVSFNQLPPGSTYIGTDGQQYQKGQ